MSFAVLRDNNTNFNPISTIRYEYNSSNSNNNNNNSLIYYSSSSSALLRARFSGSRSGGIGYNGKILVDGKLPGGQGHNNNNNNNDNDDHNDRIIVPNQRLVLLPFYNSTIVIIGINTIGWLISYCITPTTHYHVDLLGTGAFGIAAILSFQKATTKTTTKDNVTVSSASELVSVLLSKTTKRMLYSTIAVTIWSMKLAGFLLYRVTVQGKGHDSRMDTILSNPISSAQFWFISALWGIVCSLPHTMGLTTTTRPPSTTVVATKPHKSLVHQFSKYSGFLLYTSGCLVETIADYQKWTFKIQYPGMFCNVGLWSLSQHPNWFGNIVLWCGIYLWNIPGYINNDESTTTTTTNSTIVQRISQSCYSTIHQYHRFVIASLGPLFMIWLFTNEANGTLLPDSYNANRIKYQYGIDPIYTNYINTTPNIIPSIKTRFLS